MTEPDCAVNTDERQSWHYRVLDLAEGQRCMVFGATAAELNEHARLAAKPIWLDDLAVKEG